MTKTVPMIEIHQGADSPGVLTDNLIAFGATGLVVSTKMQRAFSASGIDNIQYFDVRVINDLTGDISFDYRLANVVGRIECIDLEQSELQMASGRIEFIDKLVIDESKATGARIFRLRNYLPIVVVSNLVKEKITNAGCTGVMFYRPEDYIL